MFSAQGSAGPARLWFVPVPLLWQESNGDHSWDAFQSWLQPHASPGCLALVRHLTPHVCPLGFSHVAGWPTNLVSPSVSCVVLGRLPPFSASQGTECSSDLWLDSPSRLASPGFQPNLAAHVKFGWRFSPQILKSFTFCNKDLICSLGKWWLSSWREIFSF